MFKSIIKRLCIAIFFVALTFTGLYAQQDNTVPGTRNDDGIVRQDPFVPVATKLSQSLQSRIQLDDNQTNNVRDILMSYYATVRDVQGIQRAAAKDMTGIDQKGKKKTGTSGTSSTSETDKTSTTGTGSGNYGGSGSGSNTTGSGTGSGTGQTGSGTTGGMGSGNETQRAGGRSDMDNSEIMQSLRDNDIETNQDIEDVLNDNQKSSWLNVKTSWWQEVKQEVYNFNPVSDVEQNDMNTDKNKSKKRGTGTETGTGTGSDIERR